MSGDHDALWLATCSTTVPAPVAVWLLVGDGGEAALRRFWQPATPTDSLAIDRIYYGRWLGRVDGAADEVEGVYEDVVVTRIATDKIEIHCHGGLAAGERIANDLVSAGVKRVGWEDLRRRLGSSSLQLAAERELLRAATPKAAAGLHRQLDGGWLHEIQVCRALLLAELAEEQHRVRAAITRWIEIGETLCQLVSPPAALLLGQPNAGKSTLLNRLLGYDRSIVSEVPGTTRDVIEEYVAIDGWPLRIMDAAGVRESGDLVESTGVRAAMRLATTADLVLLLVDGTVGWTEWHSNIWNMRPEALVVVTKADIASLADINLPKETHRVDVSALTGAGVQQLQRGIVERLGVDDALLAEYGPFRAKDIDLLRAAASCETLEGLGESLEQLIDACR